MNNKGFMMAEVIVVSAIVMTLLGTIYASYNKLYAIYSTRINYYDAVVIYKLAYYRDVLIENNNMNSTLNNAKGSAQEISAEAKERVFIVYNKEAKLSDTIINQIKSKNISAKFQDYITYLKDSDELIKNSNNTSNYTMIMEKCNPNNTEDCKYGYLEIFDGKEKRF